MEEKLDTMEKYVMSVGRKLHEAQNRDPVDEDEVNMLTFILNAAVKEL